MTRPPQSRVTVQERMRIAESARARRAVALPADEARADGDVGVAGDDGGGEDGEPGRVVLAVPVHAQREVEAVLVRVAVAGLHGAPDPDVERQSQDAGSARRRGPGRVVARAVVDDHDLDLAGRRRGSRR